MSAFSPQERRAAASLSVVYITRMMGLFLLLPVLSILAQDLRGATPLLMGLAVGIYALFQALLQIPFGLLSDRFGRKPVILAGLGIFVLGSIVAAMADSIWGVIVGRALQGGGAISAVVLALAADLTRDSQRTKIMAVIGASIGLSFIVSIILGPVLMSALDLSGIFYCIALSGVIAAIIVYFVVPEPSGKSKDRNVSLVVSEVPALLLNRELLRIDFGILLLHLLITASFVCIPLRLLELGIAVPFHWKVYLIGALASLLIVIPMIGIVEKKLPVNRMMMISIIGLAVAEILVAFTSGNFWLVCFCLMVFFGFLSVLESVLPSLVSRTAPAAFRGTAMGIYSTSQFFGAFLGGVLGGWLVGAVGTVACLILLGLLCLAWLLVARFMQNPPKLGVYRLPIDAAIIREPSLYEKLTGVRGVEEVTIIPSENAAYLKVRRKELDEKILLDLTSNRL